uniref:Uncharacterized protein n=1 Tax=Zea mays TaxID=4577 RepID=C4IYL9_MAIZE|nr:unknown [Zea mays]
MLIWSIYTIPTSQWIDELAKGDTVKNSILCAIVVPSIFRVQTSSHQPHIRGNTPSSMTRRNATLTIVIICFIPAKNCLHREGIASNIVAIP